MRLLLLLVCSLEFQSGFCASYCLREGYKGGRYTKAKAACECFDLYDYEALVSTVRLKNLDNKASTADY